MDAQTLKAEMNNDVEKVKQFKKRLERTKVRRCAPQSTQLNSLLLGSALGPIDVREVGYILEWRYILPVLLRCWVMVEWSP